MSDKPNKRIVQRRDDGKTEVRKPGATRASAIVSNQADGIDRAREILGNDGGGELQVPGLNGEIRRQGHDRPRQRPEVHQGLTVRPLPDAFRLPSPHRYEGSA